MPNTKVVLLNEKDILIASLYCDNTYIGTFNSNSLLIQTPYNEQKIVTFLNSTYSMIGVLHVDNINYDKLDDDGFKNIFETHKRFAITIPYEMGAKYYSRGVK